MHSVPVPINVRCYFNSDIIIRRSEVTLRAIRDRVEPTASPAMSAIPPRVLQKDFCLRGLGNLAKLKCWHHNSVDRFVGGGPSDDFHQHSVCPCAKNPNDQISRSSESSWSP